MAAHKVIAAAASGVDLVDLFKQLLALAALQNGPGLQLTTSGSCGAFATILARLGVAWIHQWPQKLQRLLSLLLRYRCAQKKQG